MAKRTRKAAEPVEHDGRLQPEERTGDVVPDVRVTSHEHPSGRTVRLCLRRGGTPVALTPEEARAVSDLLLDCAGPEEA